MSSIEYSIDSRDSLIDKYVAAFEAAICQSPETRLADYLPDRGDARYVEIASRLISIDLVSSWTTSRRKSLDHYRVRFPEVFENATAVSRIAFEEYRLRTQSGDTASPDEYKQRYRIRIDDWEARSFTREYMQDTKFPSHNLTMMSSETASTVARLIADEIEPGIVWGDFKIVAELGKGSFGKAWLAEQRSLAGRKVVLKFADMPSQEAQRLALLQHTNIVPVYSVHRLHGDSERTAICMPFAGHTTAASLLRNFAAKIPQTGLAIVSSVADESGTQPRVSSVSEAERFMSQSSYLDSVLWMVERLADALEHAHGRGIIHRDVKPANILLRNDAEPQLLDFNLAVSAERDLEEPELAGGTIPYMSPEQLASFRSAESLVRSFNGVDRRSDVYSLGVVLYELLTGFVPWEPSATVSDAPRLISDRKHAPKPPCTLNAAITPAVNAIINKCIAFDPAMRYQSASELRNELRRQLQHQPLQLTENSWGERASKWVRRNPSLFSLSSAAVLASVVLLIGIIGWNWRESQVANLRAAHRLSEFQRLVEDLTPELSAIQLEAIDEEQVREKACRVADQFGLRKDPTLMNHWKHLTPSQQRAWRQQAGTLSWLLAMSAGYESTRSEPDVREAMLNEAINWNQTAGRWIGAHNLAVKAQRQRLASSGALAEEVDSARTREAIDGATSMPPKAGSVDVPVEELLLGLEHLNYREYDKAQLAFISATRRAPRDSTAWLMLGETYLRQGDVMKAESTFDVSQILLPDSVVPAARKGECQLRQQKYGQAVESFTRVLRKHPHLSTALLNRALAYVGLGMNNLALADLNLAIKNDDVPARAYFIRARVHRRLGNKSAANADKGAGLNSTPTDPVSLVTRGVARIRYQSKKAMGDFEAALEIDPYYAPARHNMAHLYSEVFDQPEEAIHVLSKAIEQDAHDIVALAGRGVLLARAGLGENALEDVRQLSRLEIDPLSHYQVGCIYSLLIDRNPNRENLALLAVASLSRAFTADPQLVAIADGDPDLSALAENDDYQKMVTLHRQFAKLPRLRKQEVED